MLCLLSAVNFLCHFSLQYFPFYLKFMSSIFVHLSAHNGILVCAGMPMAVCVFECVYACVSVYAYV